MRCSRSIGFIAIITLMVVLSGCLGGTPLQNDQQNQTPPTDQTTSESTRVNGTPTMGEIPPLSDQTKEALERIRSKQDRITSYQATITETTVTQLSNGSQLTYVQKWNVAVKFSENGVLTRVESWSPNSSEPKSLWIQNATATIQYVPSEDEYRIQERTESTGHSEHFFPHARIEKGSYRLFEAPFPTIKKENAIQYNGTDIVNGRQADVIHLDGNPNGGNLAYYDAQTIWADTETGLVLKQTAQKPHLDSMRNISVAELRNPGAHDPMNESDDDPNAVYLGDKTITTTYTNVSVNDVPNSTFDPNIPQGADVERSTQEEG